MTMTQYVPRDPFTIKGLQKEINDRMAEIRPALDEHTRLSAALEAIEREEKSMPTHSKERRLKEARHEDERRRAPEDAAQA